MAILIPWILLFCAWWSSTAGYVVNRSLYQKQISGHHRFAMLDPFKFVNLMVKTNEIYNETNKEVTKLQMVDSLTKLRIDICYKWSCTTASPRSTATTLAFGTYSSHSNVSDASPTSTLVWFPASSNKPRNFKKKGNAGSATETNQNKEKKLTTSIYNKKPKLQQTFTVKKQWNTWSPRSTIRPL